MKLGSLTLLERYPIADGPGGPLLVRYIVAKCPWFGLCIHKLCRSDYDRALHDHPWAFISLVLWGGYGEEHHEITWGNDVHFTGHRGVGSIAYRPATWRHRVLIQEGKPAWTLVLMGPRVRRWGFWIMNDYLKKFDWCWWRKHDSERNICSDDVIHQSGGD